MIGFCLLGLAFAGIFYFSKSWTGIISDPKVVAKERSNPTFGRFVDALEVIIYFVVIGFQIFLCAVQYSGKIDSLFEVLNLAFLVLGLIEFVYLFILVIGGKRLQSINVIVDTVSGNLFAVTVIFFVYKIVFLALFQF